SVSSTPNGTNDRSESCPNVCVTSCLCSPERWIAASPAGRLSLSVTVPSLVVQTNGCRGPRGRPLSHSATTYRCFLGWSREDQSLAAPGDPDRPRRHPARCVPRSLLAALGLRARRARVVVSGRGRV